MFSSNPVTVVFLLASSIRATELWSTSPGNPSDVIRTAYPLGNGRLGALITGGVAVDVVTLNVDSLWTGGPFENPAYSGGNPDSSKSEFLPGIREWIFENGTGNVTALLGDTSNYGSYTVLGNLTVALSNVTTPTEYRRSLDLNTAVHMSSFVTGSNSTIVRKTFCSFPAQVCIYHIQSSASLPAATIGLENILRPPAPSVTCATNSIHFRGIAESPDGMIYDARASIVFPEATSTDFCTSDGTIMVPASPAGTEFWVVLAADTDYDSSKGNAESNFTFRGDDPADLVLSTASDAAKRSYYSLHAAHVSDYQALFETFSLSLPDRNGCSARETADLLNTYRSETGDAFVEQLLFDYGRYLFVSSARPNSLPPNLAGRWSEAVGAAWSGDYHANVNLQENFWGTEVTGLAELGEGLYRYMRDTWVPRGTETARLLYGVQDGWVTHDEMNIFGHTGMKDNAQWSNYPASAAWMMQTTWDRYDYSRNATWFAAEAYPLMKGVAQFWLSSLQNDSYFHDGTLVVNPCNSPEHGATTFGCTHFQQLIFELFNNVLKGWDASGDADTDFRERIIAALQLLDHGVHVGSWGQLQEWKLDLDVKNDTHRHLSHLYGWYPGYTISSVYGRNETVLDAVETTLWSRGDGDAPDGNAGWEKVWRAACWAGLNNTRQAYFELAFAIEQNFAGNGLSLYNENSPPFQIDANFGLTGAVLSFLIRDLDRAFGDNSSTQTVVLGPAIPVEWSPGSLAGARLRRGGQVSFSWDETSAVRNVSVTGRELPVVFLASDGSVLLEVAET